MQTAKRVLTTAALAGLALSTVANAGWLHFANSVVRAEQESQKHPTALTQVLVMPQDAVRPSFCASYHSTLGLGNKGRVLASATVLGVDGATKRVNFAPGKIEDNRYFRCKAGPDVEAGAIVTFDYDFEEMPRLRSGAGAAELVDVSSVVSTAGRPKLGQAVPLGLVPDQGIAPLGLVPAEKGGWFHSAKSVFQPEKESQKHPKNLAHMLVVPAESKRPKVCIAYSNATTEKNKGRVVTKVSISHVDGTEESMKFAGGVRRNEYLKCKKAGNMAPGDVVGFSYQLKGMPRLGVGAAGAEFADINGVVSTSGDPIFREPPPPPPPPTPKEEAPVETSPTAPTQPAPPAQPPATGGGGISAADEQAAFRLLKSGKPSQLQRPKGNSPSKWLATGSRTTILPNGQINLATVGLGGTIAAAVADYERKFGSFGPGGSLNATEKSLLGWYSAMDASQGPTSCRRDAGGNYYGEFYRPSHGVRHNGPLGSMAAALDWMKKQGI